MVTKLDAKGIDWLMWLAKGEDESLDLLNREAQDRANNPRRYRRATRKAGH